MAEQKLNNGEPLVVFPEGRCSAAGRLSRLQPGAALLSLRTGCPIVPIGLVNTNKILPYGKGIPRVINERVTVNFGVPIDPNDYAGQPRNEAIDAITRRLGCDIAALSNQPEPAIQPMRTRKRNVHEQDME